MDFFASKRVITILAVFLVVLNVVLLGMLWQQNRGHLDGIRIRSFGHHNPFARSLALNETQTLSFQKLRREHMQKVRPEMQAIEQLKKQLVEEALKVKPDSQKIGDLAASIGSRQATIERELALHFHELSIICKPEQQDSLKSVLDRMAMHKFSGRKDGRGFNPHHE
jgi:Spy/CpxP family protein refolding chaperone